MQVGGDKSGGLGLAMEVESPEYRAAALAGRARALREITDLIYGLAHNIEPEHGPEVTLGTLVSNWLEVVAWLNQAEAEAVDELALLRHEGANVAPLP